MHSKFECPENFYKYRSLSTPEQIENVRKTVLSGELYFAAAQTMNDPFELRPTFDLSAPPEVQRADYIRMSKKFEPGLTDAEREEEADRVMAASMTPTELGNTVAGIQALHSHFLSTSIGVYCATTKPDNLLMWTHYADCHRGICLEFDGLIKPFARAQKVNYSDRRVPINPYTDDQIAMMTKGLLTKSMHWRYEEEWRMINYQGGPGAIIFEKPVVTGIIIGALATSKTIELVNEWAKSRTQGGTPLRILRAQICDRDYKLHLKPLA